MFLPPVLLSEGQVKIWKHTHEVPANTLNINLLITFTSCFYFSVMRLVSFYRLFKSFGYSKNLNQFYLFHRFLQKCLYIMDVQSTRMQRREGLPNYYTEQILFIFLQNTILLAVSEWTPRVGRVFMILLFFFSIFLHNLNVGFVKWFIPTDL